MKLAGYNAYWGCFTCYIPGASTEWGLEYRGAPPFHLRAPAHYFCAEIQAGGFGYQGVPCFAKLHSAPTSFNIIWDTVLDPMHNLFLGVACRIFEHVWFASNPAGPHNIYHYLPRIDRIFLDISVPHDWTRKPTSLYQALATWKGLCYTVNHMLLMFSFS